MNAKKLARMKELQEEIYELEHDRSRAGGFQPKLIPLYKEYQQLIKQRKNG